MKKINTLTKYLLAIAAAVTFAACEKSDEWKPGPQPPADNPDVYFASDVPRIFEIAANSKGELKKDYFTIAMGRDEFKAATALQVPIIIRYAESNLTVAKTAEFAAGSTEAELKVNIGEFEFTKQYDLSIEIDKEYCNPYKSYSEAEQGGSTKLDMKVEVVSLLGEATFTPNDYSGSNIPEFTPFTHRIYDNMNGTYTIKNFLYNNAGYNFTFSLDEDNNIVPDENEGFFEEGSGSAARWYFYSANSSSSSSRIPCYLPGANPDDYITYIYFYLDPTYRYTGFWIDTETKTGQMVGYSRYSVSSSGRVTFDITWD